MTKNIAQPIPHIAFVSLDHSGIGIRTLEIDTLYSSDYLEDYNPALPHRLAFHCLVYITRSSGTHFIDFKAYPFEAGSLTFINQNQVHEFYPDSKPEGKVVFFTQEFIEAIRVNISASQIMPNYHHANHYPVINIGDILKQSCETLLCEIEKEETYSQGDDLTKQLLFASLLLKLNRNRASLPWQNLNKSRAKKFEQFITLVERDFKTCRDASVYAKLLNMTYKSLNQICKLASNQTAKQFIDAHTILEAKRRLAADATKVEPLAFQLGFDEVTNFVKYFKRHTNTTPKQFKLGNSN